MSETNYVKTSGFSNFKDNFRRLLLLRSDDYNQYGKYLVQEFNYGNIWLRGIGELGDITIMLLPITIWVDVFLFVTTGMVPVAFLYAIMTLTIILMILFTAFGNSYCSLLFSGQSFGKVCLRLKVVNSDNTQCERNTIIIREVLGKEVPLILLFIFLGVKGALLFLVINGLFVIIDKQHRSIVDIPLKTKVVILSPMGMKHDMDQLKVIEPVVVAKPVQSENQIDLHLYSTFSHDGELEVEDLIKQAHAMGIKTISITDHNSVKANMIAMQVAKLYDINYVPGINIDCEYEGYHVRLLGYFIDSGDERYARIEYENLAKEKAISLRRVALFESFSGLHVDSDKLLEHNRFQIISGEMIARNVLNNINYQKEKLLQPYLSGRKRDKPITNFVKDFFSPNAVAYVPIIQPKLIDMIALVKATGGVCVLAHPMHSLRDNPDLIEQIIPLGIDGLEVFTPYHSLDDMKHLIDIAKKYHLDVTEGSEYHGTKHKKQFEMGKTYCPHNSEVVVEHFVKKHQ